ncbi:MAG: carboxypeptidase regulatory-like domain-containing protein [Thermoplasmatota archaeon]
MGAGSSSADNGVIESYSWSFTYESEERTIIGETASFLFNTAGNFTVTLTVRDQFGNTGTDTLTVTVIDKGHISGIVLDKDGNPVEGATIIITASNGEKFTTFTGSDGSFSLEVYYGSFSWEISKDGYKTLTGSSSVDPMGELDLDLSGHPLTREEEEGGSFIWIIIVLVVVLIMIAIVIFFLMRKKKEPHEDEVTEKIEQDVESGEIPMEQLEGIVQSPVKSQLREAPLEQQRPPAEVSPEENTPPSPIQEPPQLPILEETPEVPTEENIQQPVVEENAQETDAVPEKIEGIP